MKFLLVAFLCIAAVAAYTEHDLEYALFEDAGILETIKERIKQGFQKVLDRVKELIEQHKPLVENLKERLAALKERVHDLLTQTGKNFLQTVHDIRAKIQELLRQVVQKIGDGSQETVEYALYDEPNFFEQLIQRIRERVQAAFEKLRELVAKHKETISAALKEKIEQVKQKLAELALEHGQKLLDKAREVGAKIGEVVKEVLAKILHKEETALYAVEEEGETFLEGLKRRIVERLQKAVEDIKAKVAQIKSDFAEKVKPKIQEIIEKIKDMAKQSGEKLLETAGEISQKIREILTQVKDQILGGAYYNAEILEAARALKKFFTTDEGVKALKDHAGKTTPSTQTGFLIKAFILASTPAALKELVNELFKNVNYFYIPVNYADIKDLVRKAAAYLQTDEGVAMIREYAKNLQTAHPVVLRLQEMLGSASDAEVKSLMRDIFSVEI